MSSFETDDDFMLELSHALNPGLAVNALPDLMAVWIYADESESDSGPRVFTLAGFNAAPTGWRFLIEKWREMLRDAGPYPVDSFHAADLMAAKPPYDGWTPTQRDDFRNRAVDILCDRSLAKNLYAAACTIVVDEFGFAQKPTTYDLYLLCAESFFYQALSFSPHMGVDFIFDKKEKVQGRVAGRFFEIQDELGPQHRGLLRGVSFQDDRVAVPLQAADLLAHEARAFNRAHHKDPSAMARGAYLRLKESFQLAAEADGLDGYRIRNFKCLGKTVAKELAQRYPSGNWQPSAILGLAAPEEG